MPAPKIKTRPETLSGSPLPFDYQIAGLIRNNILEGTWPAGSQLPTENKLAKHLGLKKNNAVLVVKTVYFDESRQPIEYVETKYKGELPYSIRVKRN